MFHEENNYLNKPSFVVGRKQ